MPVNNNFNNRAKVKKMAHKQDLLRHQVSKRCTGMQHRYIQILTDSLLDIGREGACAMYEGYYSQLDSTAA